MKREDILPIYKTLAQMRELADKRGDAIKKDDFDKASQIKEKILELQRSLKKII